MSVSRALRARALGRPRETLLELLERPSRHSDLGATLDVLVEEIDLRALRNIDRGLRAIGLRNAHWLNGSRGIGLPACLSMVRDGYIRQAALERLLSSRTPRAHAFIALRLADPVHQIREVAGRALSPKLPGALLVEALVITERLRHSRYRWQPAIQALRDNIHPDALEDGSRSSQPAVREVCHKLLLERGVGGALVERIGRILEEERTPDLRRHAASRASGEVLEQLLPRFEVDRSPEIRRMAVRARATRGELDDKDALLRMCFDRDSTTRHLARMGLAKLGGAVDLRARALRLLDDERSSTGDLIGALSVLADLGRRVDLEKVRAFSERAGALGREAQRTIGILETL